MRRVDERSTLGGIADRWDALVAATPSHRTASPFMWSWWLDAMADGRDATFVTVSAGSDLIGGVPLQRRTVKGLPVWSLLGSGPLQPDPLDLVAAPGREGEVVTALGRHFRGMRGVLELDGVLATSLLGLATAGLGRRHDVSTVAAPFAGLGTSAAEYLSGRPGSHRSTVARTWKRLRREGVRFEIVDSSDADGAEATLDVFASLHDGRWGERSAVLSDWDRCRRALVAGVARGDVWLAQLVDSAGRSIAIEVDLLVPGRVCFYQAGRLTDHEFRGSGSALKFSVIEAAIDEGSYEYDLLRGAEPYKDLWATGSRELASWRVGLDRVGRAALAARRMGTAIAARRR